MASPILELSKINKSFGHVHANKDITLKINKGTTSLEFRKKMSQLAFIETAYYDSVISNYFNKTSNIYFPQKKIIRFKMAKEIFNKINDK